MPPSRTPVKLAIVDDHNLFRKGLKTLIEIADKQNKYLIVFEAANGQEMISKLDKKILPDIILMDVEMSDMDGYEAVAWLREHYPGIAVLVISMVDSEEAIMRMLRLGVKGYLSKDIEVEDIHNALKHIQEKGHYYTDFLTGKLINALAIESVDFTGEKNKPANQIKEHERTFLKYVCSDLTYPEIAAKMFLSPKTIDGYRDELFRRFNVKSKVGLALYAIQNGLVKIPIEGLSK